MQQILRNGDCSTVELNQALAGRCFSEREHCYQFVRKYGKTVDIQIIYGQFIVMSKDCRESNVQRASFMLKVESGDSAKLSLSSGTKYS